jgi:hypothetical protein
MTAPLPTLDGQALEKAAKDMAAAIELVRECVTDGAPEGFNPSVGDWAERLYRSQHDTHKALAAYRAYLAAAPSAATPQPVADAEGRDLGLPWTIEHGSDGSWQIEGRDGRVICSRSQWPNRATESRASGDLILSSVRAALNPGPVTTEAGAGEVEPVAWRWQHRSEGSPWVATDALPSFAFDKDDGGKDWFNREPLYSASALTAVRADLARVTKERDEARREASDMEAAATALSHDVSDFAARNDKAESDLTTLQASYDSLVGGVEEAHASACNQMWDLEQYKDKPNLIYRDKAVAVLGNFADAVRALLKPSGAP